MKVNGKMTSDVVMGTKSTQTAIFTTVVLRGINQTEKEHSIGSNQQRFTKVNGLMPSEKATVFGKMPKVTHISVNGNKVKPKATEFIHGQITIGMKDSGSTAQNMAKVSTNSQTATPIKENIVTANLKDTECTGGLMDQSTKANFITA